MGGDHAEYHRWDLYRRDEEDGARRAGLRGDAGSAEKESARHRRGTDEAQESAETGESGRPQYVWL